MLSCTNPYFTNESRPAGIFLIAVFSIVGPTLGHLEARRMNISLFYELTALTSTRILAFFGAIISFHRKACVELLISYEEAAFLWELIFFRILDVSSRRVLSHHAAANQCW